MRLTPIESDTLLGARRNKNGTGGELMRIHRAHLNEPGADPEKKDQRPVVLDGQKPTRPTGPTVIRMGKELVAGEVVCA